MADAEGLTRHLKDLKAAARRLTPREDEAEDLVQECLAHAVQGLARVRHPQIIGAWLLQILRRRWYDRLRRRAVEKRLQGNGRLVASPGGVQADPELVRKALSALCAEDRRILELRFFDSIPAVEIARRMGKPAGTVRSAIFHALRKFSSEYEKVCRGEEP